MFGLSPATLPHAIRTGSWLAREALTDARGIGRSAAALCVIAAAVSTAPLAAYCARAARGAPPASAPPVSPLAPLPPSCLAATDQRRPICAAGVGRHRGLERG